jgi:PIN domain
LLKVVLDTNIFCQDFRMRSSNFRLLREGLRVIPAELKVPEVVLDEVVNRFAEDLEEAVAEARKAEAGLARLLAGPLNSSAKTLNVGKETEAYREWLIASLEEAGVEILPYPDVPHKEVVRRDLQRRHPFKRDGSGYRDCLIWENVRELVRNDTDSVVFVTANKSDFGQGPRVAADLQQDVPDSNCLEIVTSLAGFNDKFVLPKLSPMHDLKARLQNVAGSSFDVPRWLQDNLLNLLRDEELAPIVLGFPQGAGSLWPRHIINLEVKAVDDVRRLSGGETLVSVKVRVRVKFSVDIDWDDFVQHPEVREWVGDDSEPFSSMFTEEDATLDIEIRLVLDANGKSLTDQEIQSICGPFGDVELSSW